MGITSLLRAIIALEVLAAGALFLLCPWMPLGQRIFWSMVPFLALAFALALAHEHERRLVERWTEQERERKAIKRRLGLPPLPPPIGRK